MEPLTPGDAPTMRWHDPETRALLRRGALAIAAAAAALAGLSLPTGGAAAGELHRWPDADIALGERLLREHRCAECHVRRVGGDGTAIYRPQGRINTPGALRGMVEYCSVELKLSLFPEEVSSIAAVLQRDHYRFPAAPRAAAAASAASAAPGR